MYLLDTNHCSRIIQGHSGLIKKLTELKKVKIATCSIVAGELMFMAYKEAENLKVEQWWFP